MTPDVLYEEVIEVKERLVLHTDSCKLKKKVPVITGVTKEQVSLILFIFFSLACSLTHLLTHSLILSCPLTHTRSLVHSLTHSLRPIHWWINVKTTCPRAQDLRSRQYQVWSKICVKSWGSRLYTSLLLMKKRCFWHESDVAKINFWYVGGATCEGSAIWCPDWHILFSMF